MQKLQWYLDFKHRGRLLRPMCNRWQCERLLPRLRNDTPSLHLLTNVRRLFSANQPMRVQAMSKKYCYVISYDEQEQEWFLDTDMEEQRFKYGTIYDYDLRQWQYPYSGDGEYNGQEEYRTGQVVDLIERLNKLETPKTGAKK